MKVTTIFGLMDESLLEKRVGTIEPFGDHSGGTFVEYWKDGELVHRSLTLGLLGRTLTAEAGRLN